MCNATIEEATWTCLKYRQLIKEEKYSNVCVESFANELGSLALGIYDVKRTNIIHFILCSALPLGCTITYGCIVVDYRLQNHYPNWTRLTVGIVWINYPWKVATSTTDLMRAKFQLSGVDVIKLYLNTPLDFFEYMWLFFDLIPKEISHNYNWHCIANSW